MLDLKFIRQNPNVVRDAMAKKNVELDLDRLLALDEQRRALLTEVEQLKAQRNTVSEEVGKLKKAGQDATLVITEMRQVGDRIKVLDDEVRTVTEELDQLLLTVPNIPDSDVPVGADESANVEISRWGTPRAFGFEPKPHWEIGTDLDILDFERAAKATGTRFVYFKGVGARLVRALMNFMLDLHVSVHGYTEHWVPLMVNEASMTATGQFPKFKEDVFTLRDQPYYLIPTAETALVNMHRDEVLSVGDLPLRYCAYSPCFRSEAGAAGRDTRGLVRMHQFDKVELVAFTRPEESAAELEKLTRDAEDLLRHLELPYHVIFMCTGDMGFQQAKKYDLELWMPSYGRYVEISSASNIRDFQARRGGIRFRNDQGKVEFVHTLNASGLAIGRTVAAILENYQEADGSVTIPEVLRPYMGGWERIEPIV